MLSRTCWTPVRGGSVKLLTVCWLRNDDSIASTIAGASAGVGAMFSMSLPNVHAPPGPVRTGSSTTLTSRISSSRRGLIVHGVELSKTEKFTIWLNDSKLDENSWAFTPICDVPNCSMSGEALTANGRCAVLAAGTNAIPEVRAHDDVGVEVERERVEVERRVLARVVRDLHVVVDGRSRRHGRGIDRRHAHHRGLREARQLRDLGGRRRDRVEDDVVDDAVDAALVGVVAHEQRAHAVAEPADDALRSGLHPVEVELEEDAVVGRGDVRELVERRRGLHVGRLAVGEADDDLEVLAVLDEHERARAVLTLPEDRADAAELRRLDPCRDGEALGEHEVRLVRHDDEVVVLVEADARIQDARTAEGRHRAERRVVAEEAAVEELGAVHVAVVEAPEALGLAQGSYGSGPCRPCRSRRRAERARGAHARAADPGPRRPSPRRPCPGRPLSRPRRPRPSCRRRPTWCRRCPPCLCQARGGAVVSMLRMTCVRSPSWRMACRSALSSP